MTGWSEADTEFLRQRWRAGHRPSSIAKEMNRSRGSILGKSARMGFSFPNGGRARTLDSGHDAAVEGRTLFPTKVVQAPLDPVFTTSQISLRVLKPGAYQRKLGNAVKKGKWKGMPIFALTLEERSTCPASCKQWHSCYGNGMPHSVRFAAGERLEAALLFDLTVLQEKYPRGFVVRLHILGDFYSVSYVNFWRLALCEFPALRVFGYTAWREWTEIGQAICAIRDARWSRFAVRTSGSSSGPYTAVKNEADKSLGEIVCPVQRGLSQNCGTCGLCWASKRPIIFHKH